MVRILSDIEEDLTSRMEYFPKYPPCNCKKWHGLNPTHHIFEDFASSYFKLVSIISNIISEA